MATTEAPSGQRAEALVVWAILQQSMSPHFELAAELGQSCEVRKLQAKRGDGRRDHRHRQGKLD
jgi:hypothetical protein